MLVNEALNPHGSYAMIPNALYSLGLKAGAIAAYGFLSSCECRRRGDRDRYTCHPSQATIASAIGCSRKTAGKYVRKLVEAGLIATEGTKVTTADGLRWNGNLRYTLLDPQRAVELYHERQLAGCDAHLAGCDAHLASGVRKKRKAMKKAEKKRERRQIPHAEYVATRTAREPEELP